MIGATRLPLALVTLVALLAACAEPAPESTTAAAPAISRTAEGAGARLELHVPVERAVVGDPIVLTVTVSAGLDDEVTFDEIEEQLGAFDVESVEDTPGLPVEDGRRWTRRVTISTFESGVVEIPALGASIAPGDGGEPVPLTVEPVALEIASVIEGEFDPGNFRDIKGAVDLDLPVPTWWWFAGGGGALALLVLILAVVWLLRRRARRGPSVPVLAPDAWARQALAALRADELPARGEIHAFYVRLSDIVRRYIERRFDLHAPEQTTEEFLRSRQTANALGDGRRDELRAFLRAADLVKFALHRPQQAECDDALASAERFVEQTARPDAPVQDGEVAA